MAGTATPIFAQIPINPCAALINGTGAFTFSAASNVTTNLVSLVVGGTNGSIVNGITVTSTDTGAATLLLILNNGTYNFILGEYNIPATSGFTTSAPAVDLLRNAQAPQCPIDVNGNRYFYVPNGYTVYVGTTGVVTSAKQISIIATGENF